MHHVEVPDNIKSVNIVRLFPEGKSYYCCLCDNIIGSFQNFKRHYKNKHKGISLVTSAKCIICERSFTDCRGAGVHLQRAHGIGKSDDYPLSKTPVMSYVDLESAVNNTTIASSRCSRRSRVGTLLNLPLSMSRTLSSPVTCSLSTLTDVNHVPSPITNPTLPPPTDPSLTPIPFPTTPSNLPVRVPFPVLSDLDPDEDIVPSTLPRPSVSSTPSSHHQPSFEPVVALDGCTTGNNDVPMVCPSQPRNPSPTQLTSNPSETQPSSPIHQSSPEPPVALNGCTDGDGNGCLFPNSPTTASQNPFIIPPPLADTSFLTSTVPPSHPDNANNHHAHPPTSSQDNCDKSFQNRWSSVFSSNSTWQEFPPSVIRMLG